MGNEHCGLAISCLGLIPWRQRSNEKGKKQERKEDFSLASTEFNRTHGRRIQSTNTQQVSLEPKKKKPFFLISYFSFFCRAA
jgi:hypothetical protein